MNRQAVASAAGVSAHAHARLVAAARKKNEDQEITT